MTVIKYGRVLPKHDWSKNKKNTILHKNLNSTYSYNEMHGKDILFFSSSSVRPPPPPNPGPNIERTKLSPKPQQCPRLCNHLKWKSRYSFINNTDRWRWKYLRRQCHTASPPTKQQAALTRSENCCFAMQTRCFLRIRAVGLGKKTDCCFVLFCFFSLPSFSHELQ